MKSPSKWIYLAYATALLALFAAGEIAARALGLRFPGAVVGLALMLLGLRVGVMFATAYEPPRAPARQIRPGAREPALRAANG